jgi:hypothetical protein
MNREEIRAALNRHWSESAAGDQETEHEIYTDDTICGLNHGQVLAWLWTKAIMDVYEAATRRRAKGRTIPPEGARSSISLSRASRRSYN